MENYFLGGSSGIVVIVGIAIGLFLEEPVSQSTYEKKGGNPVDFQRPDSDSKKGLENKSAYPFSIAEKRQDQIKSTETKASNYGTAMLRLLEGVSILGFDHSEMEALKDIIGNWYDEDPASALMWIAELQSKSIKQFFYESLAAKIALSDIDDAIQFVQRYLKDFNLPIDLGNNFFQEALNKSPDTFIKAMMTVIHQDNSSAIKIVRLEFPEDFPYPSMMESYLAAEFPDTARGRFERDRIPREAITAWAKKDPHAAYQWIEDLDQAGKLEKLSEFTDVDLAFFDGYAEVADAKDYGNFVGQYFKFKGVSEASYGDAWRFLSENFSGRPNEENVRGKASVEVFLNETSNLADRNSIIMGILASSEGERGWGSATDSLRSHLFGLLSDEEQLAFLRRAPKNARNHGIRFLKNKGYTHKQIRRALR